MIQEAAFQRLLFYFKKHSHFPKTCEKGVKKNENWILRLRYFARKTFTNIILIKKKNFLTNGYL